MVLFTCYDAGDDGTVLRVMSYLLLVGFYRDRDSRRMSELTSCLERNVRLAHFNEVHVFVEKRDRRDRYRKKFSVLRDPKVRLIDHGRRVTYREFFDYANRVAPGQRVIIANSDIFFDDSLRRLDSIDFSGKLVGLTRWDILENGTARPYEDSYSQDAWIFQSPIRPFFCDFHLGLPGCDNRIAWEAHHSGLQLLNPSRSVRANHLHLSGVRRYSQDQRLKGELLSIPLIALESTP